jgi:hypothetical protein
VTALTGATLATAPIPLSVPIRRSGISVTALLGLVGYRLLVDYGYQLVVAGPFKYQGFQAAATPMSLALSWGVLLALAPLVLRILRTETLSAQVTSLLVLLSLVPTTTLIAYDGRYSIAYVALMFIYWLLLLLSTVYVPAIQVFRRPLRSEVPHLLTLAVLATTVLYVSWRFTGFRLHFGVFDVYSLRAEARQYEVATIVGYIATMADNTLPVLLAYYLRRRWWPIAIGVALVILFNFGISATKQVLFLLILGASSAVVQDDARVNRAFFAGLAAVFALAIAEKLFVGTVLVGSISFHRLAFVPAHLHWITYDFFQTHDLLYLTQSALRFFFESPYRENVQFLLGEYFIGDITARANNGLFSDGFMNFGAASVAVYPVLCVLVLKLVEGSARGLPMGVNVVLIGALTFVLQGVPIPTALLTSGVAFLIVLLSTLPRPRDAAMLRVTE